MTEIKHVFFDLDHTLWDFEKNSDLTFEKLFLKNKVDVNLKLFLEKYKPINREYWKLYREEKITKPELRYQRLKKAFDGVNYKVSDDLINIMAIEYIENLPHFNHLFDYTFEILDYLKDNYQLHIITNGFQEIQSKKMKSSNILEYFSQIITSESVGVKKPNPRVFEFALQSANAKKENSVMIGDSIEADILGALDAGMHAIHCNFENEHVNATNFTSIKSLRELRNYL